MHSLLFLPFHHSWVFINTITSRIFLYRLRRSARYHFQFSILPFNIYFRHSAFDYAVKMHIYTDIPFYTPLPSRLHYHALLLTACSSATPNCHQASHSRLLSLSLLSAFILNAFIRHWPLIFPFIISSQLVWLCYSLWRLISKRYWYIISHIGLINIDYLHTFLVSKLY